MTEGRPEGTHLSGMETPVTDWKQRIVETLEPHRGEPIAPKDHFTYTAELLQPLFKEAQAEAWEDGFHEGRANVTHNTPCDGRLWYDDDALDENPYR